MAKKDNTVETPVDDKLLFDAMPGADAKTEEDAKPFEVDMNFESPEEEGEVEFPKEEEIEEVEELKAEEEPVEEPVEEPEEEAEEEAVEVADEETEDTGEEELLEEDDGDPQQPEGTDEEEPVVKEPMIPKSRFDEVLAKQKALAKKLEEATNPIDQVEGEPEYDFDGKEAEYQEHVLNGRTTDASKLRAEIRNAERQSMMFEVQNRMGKTVEQSTEMSALQAKATELAENFPILNETHADFDEVKTQEVLDLRDAFMVQGFSGSDALDKAAKYVVGSPVVETEETKVQKKIVQKKKIANTQKKLEAAEKQPPSMKGKTKTEKKLDINTLSTDEFDALPPETLRRMRGDFG